MSSSVSLSPQQETTVKNVLELFAGRATKEILQQWNDDAVFEDQITIARGRKQFEAQWYGLKTAFSEIEKLHSEVKSSGNPITLDLKQRYVVKGINKEETISSVVEITTSADGSKIEHVKDKWNGELPDGALMNAFRKLNAVTVPAFVSVPKDAASEKA